MDSVMKKSLSMPFEVSNSANDLNLKVEAESLGESRPVTVSKVILI
jgi:hypothetical protein